MHDCFNESLLSSQPQNVAAVHGLEVLLMVPLVMLKHADSSTGLCIIPGTSR